MTLSPAVSEAGDWNGEALICAATLTFGRLHWYLLRADALMTQARFGPEPTPTEDGAQPPALPARRARSTPFDDEVGGDEIGWWIDRKESDLEALEEQAQLALSAAQALLTGARELQGIEPDSYDALLRSLRAFATANAANLQVLLDFAAWLNSRSPLAPAILFSYKIWGTTRRATRTIDLGPGIESPDDEAAERLQMLTEIAWGLRDKTILAVEKEWFEQTWALIRERSKIGGTAKPAVLETGRVLRLSARRVTEDVFVYLTCLRDSLRHIVAEIGKRKNRTETIAVDPFWSSLIHLVAETKAAPPADCLLRESLPLWHGPKDARRRGAIEFCTDVAALANAGGGCLIVGIAPHHEIVGLGGGVEAQVEKLEAVHRALAAHLRYPRTITFPLLVPVLTRNAAGTCCLIIGVARACEPAFVSADDGRLACLLRRGTDNVACDPHALLAQRAHQRSDRYDFLPRLKLFVREQSRPVA